MRFLSWRAGRLSETDALALWPLERWSEGVGLATWERDVAATSHEPVGDRVWGSATGGAKIASSGSKDDSNPVTEISWVGSED